MKKLLLTGFEPFLHYTENPTTEIVKYFHQRKVNDYHIKGKVLPVQFEEAGRLIITYIHEYNPDIIISLGIAKGRSKVTPERIARSEEHTSELQSRGHLVCRLLLEKKNITSIPHKRTQ